LQVTVIENAALVAVGESTIRKLVPDGAANVTVPVPAA